MKPYTDQEIAYLITCPKKIVEPPKKEMKIEYGHKRNSMELRSENEDKFTVFMRVNIDFPENFSIGLDYWPKDEKGNLPLLRCNGPHGEVSELLNQPKTHFVPHVHKAKEENIIAGLRAEKGAEPTGEYITFEQALTYFLNFINIKDVESYFQRHPRLPIFTNEGERQ
jgi:hypothetical protein